ncbi:MAG: PAS domain S-box protein [Proteobacteria bacterium]|nr:PAS domain S-box protein [Pseudomonadota bacterium]
MLERFFVYDLGRDPLLWRQHDPWLVALSIAVSIGASAVALHLAVLAREAGNARRRQMALSSGALALASGVWTMHFIGMLAFAACGQARFNLWLTALSALPCLAASWVALRLLVREQAGARALAGGALLVGAGIGSMHYIGMAASELAPLMVYDLHGFLFSLLVAVALAGLALWVRFGLRQYWLKAWGTAVAGSVMGLAIVGMHYTGMAALRFHVPIDEFNQVASSVPLQTSLSLAIAIIVVSLCLLLVAANASRRYHDMLLQSQLSEARQRAVLETAVDATIMIDGQGTVQSFNPAAERLLGWSVREVLGRNVNMFMPEPHRSAHDGYLQRHLATGHKAIIGQGREMQALHRDGHTIPIRLAVGRVDQPGAPLFVGFLTDLTEAKARSAELEGTLAAINRSRPAAEFDVQGCLVTANAHYLDLLGYTLPEIVGRPHRFFCPPDFADSPRYEEFWSRLRRGEFQGGEFQRFGKEGRAVWLLTIYNPIFGADGKVSKVIEFAADMTQRRAMEQELREAKERAEAAAAARASFLANMSHEIRTPMNAILGFTEAVLDTPLGARQRRYLGTVRHSARSLLRLLNDILDTAKLDKGAVALELAPFDLRALCGQILDSLGIGASKKGLSLVLDYPDTVPGIWRGDAFRLQQILVNLLGNAVKFTHQGSVRLQVAGRGGALAISVQDSGIGMNQAVLQRLFDPFSQADASTTRRYGGTGLGTSIAQKLAELMGGGISVHSREGEDSRFTVHLPLAEASRQDLAAIAAAVGPGAGALPPLRVLAVDDVATNLELVQIQLRRGGHQLVLAGSGAEALQAFARDRFDVVLMDLHMPDMDGMQTTSRLRDWEREHRRPRTAIIALSASVLEQDRRAAAASGMDGFAAKPLDTQQLEREIARVLGLHLAAQPPAAAAAPQAEPAIDWPRGLALWGERGVLWRALQRFVQDHAELPAQLRAARGDSVALAALAHRLRGAAGNLALPALYRVLGEIEAAARAGDTRALRHCLPALDSAWAAVHGALADAGDGTEGSAAPAATAPAPPDRPLALAALDQVDQALARGELPDAALATLAQCLPAELLAPLQAAVDAFDFEAARRQLDPLRRHLENAAP